MNDPMQEYEYLIARYHNTFDNLENGKMDRMMGNTMSNLLRSSVSVLNSQISRMKLDRQLSQARPAQAQRAPARTRPAKRKAA